MQFSVLTWHSFQCFFKYSSGLSFNTVGKQKRLSGKKRLPGRRRGWPTYPKSTTEKKKRNTKKTGQNSSCTICLRKETEKNQVAWQASKKRMFRDKTWSNFEPWRWTGWKKTQETDGNDIKGRAEPAIQRQSKHWLVILTTLLALSELCGTDFGEKTFATFFKTLMKSLMKIAIIK